jgi:dTDP-4-amino-4,6-dideoxygalactose transaminase
MKIPFVDLHRQYLRIKDEIDAAIAGVIRNSAYIGGDHVSQFEAEFADWLGIDHVVGCANGTDSIEMLLDALAVGAGDEVIVPALSWISTAEAVGTRGAKPVFVDIDATYCIDPTKIESKITARTKAIIPVHLYGCPANMPAIMNIAERHNLFVLEDCAQAHGAMINGQKVGTFGHCASFSFYPGKNLGAYGDAGGLATNDANIAQKVRMIANHGQPQKHTHLIEGRNSRMDGMHAAVLSVKLRHLDTWTEERIQAAARYHDLLAESDLSLPQTPEGYKHVFHLYVVQSANRDALAKTLETAGVSTAIHYPTPMPAMDCYAKLQTPAEDFAIASAACKRILSLPIFGEIRKEELEYLSNTCFGKES